MKKSIGLMCMFILGVLIMIGCSKQTNEEQSESTPETLNEEGFPIVDEEISLEFFARRSPQNGPYEDMLVFQEYADMTNIKVEWDDVPQDNFDERKSLELASGELPDVFYKASLSQTQAVEYGSSGIFIALEDLIDEYAPNLTALFEQYPEIKSSITAPDGHIYALPAIIELDAARNEKFWVNKDWLDTLGLDEPTTADELIEVLTAFKNDDPNGNGEQDEIPLTERNLYSLINTIGGSWGLLHQMGNTINIENDEVQFWKTSDRYKELLQFLNQLYSEGLLDREVLTHNQADYMGKVAAGKIGMSHIQANDLNDQAKEWEYIGISPVKGPHGDQIQPSGPIARDFGTFAITSNNEHPAATIRWLDYFFSEEGSIMFRYGIEDETFYYDEEGLPEYSDEIYDDPRGYGVAIGDFTPYPGGGAPQYITEYNASGINPPAVQEAQKQLDDYLPEIIYGPPLFDVDTAEEVEQIRQDMDAYYNESTAKFINGDMSFDQWDDYVSTIENMGLSRLIEIYQEAYDTQYKD
ncbi:MULTISPECIES: extracellular solute-binding protein [Gracilibacillus]|uniref:extracellular solute-binding protein n=1 Tax=Gracilibacillus TaxID=74385 RepID=UPI0008250AC1|nr:MULTISPECIES: extracellular solute-binding protein [Gracilibacillus]